MTTKFPSVNVFCFVVYSPPTSIITGSFLVTFCNLITRNRAHQLSLLDLLFSVFYYTRYTAYILHIEHITIFKPIFNLAL